MTIHKLFSQIVEQGFDPLTMAVASVPALYQLPQSELDNVKTELIRSAFRFHYSNNAFYRATCELKRVHPAQIVGYQDLINIPLIPISSFKSARAHELLSKPLNLIEHEMSSSGTSGTPSIARRCTETLDLAVTGIYAMYREFFGISKGAGLYLCPSTEEIPEMGMIKALNMLAGLLDTHRFMVKQDRFVAEDAISQLNSWKNSFTRHIIGPPFLVYRLLQFIKQTGMRIKLDKGSRVITLGGWKHFTGKMISRKEFNLLCEECLGVPPEGVRDIYGLVESNVMAIDDEHQMKHVSPFVHFSARDMNDSRKEVPDGKPGILAILDPTSRSTPGMILTEDIVILYNGIGPSGRSGQQMVYVMRAPTSPEFGCCAVNLERKMGANQNEPASAFPA